MDFDDDAPPELVDTAGLEEVVEIAVKVPITIVTGMALSRAATTSTLMASNNTQAILELEKQHC